MQSSPVSFNPTPPLPPLLPTHHPTAEAGPSSRAAEAALPQRPPAAALRASGSAPRQPLAAVPAAAPGTGGAGPAAVEAQATGYRRPPLSILLKSKGVVVSGLAMLAGTVGLATSAGILSTGRVPESGQPVDLDPASPDNQTSKIAIAAIGSGAVLVGGAVAMAVRMRRLAREHFEAPAEHELLDLGAALAEGPAGAPALPAPAAGLPQPVHHVPLV